MTAAWSTRLLTSSIRFEPVAPPSRCAKRRRQPRSRGTGHSQRRDWSHALSASLPSARRPPPPPAPDIQLRASSAPRRPAERTSAPSAAPLPKTDPARASPPRAHSRRSPSCPNRTSSRLARALSSHAPPPPPLRPGPPPAPSLSRTKSFLRTPIPC